MMVEVIESRNLQSGQNGSYEDSIYKWRIKVAQKANGHYPSKLFMGILNKWETLDT